MRLIRQAMHRNKDKCKQIKNVVIESYIYQVLIVIQHMKQSPVILYVKILILNTVSCVENDVDVWRI